MGMKFFDPTPMPEREPECAECGTLGDQFYKLANDDYVCSEECYQRYRDSFCELYLNPKRVRIT